MSRNDADDSVGHAPVADATLVIGAAGYVGAAVARRLNAAGMPVHGLASRKPQGVSFARFHHGRSELRPLLMEALRDVRNVVWLGGTTRPGSSMASLGDEIGAEALHVIEVAELAAEMGVACFAFISSGGAIYGATAAERIAEAHPTSPINSYGLAKLVAEQGLRLVSRRTGMRTVSLRVANPYGPGQAVKGNQGFVAALSGAAREGRAIEIWGDGSVIRDFVFIDDVAAAFERALRVETASGAINIGSGAGHSLAQVIAAYERASGRSVAVTYRPARSVDVERCVLDVSLADTVLGWRPTIGLDEGLARTIAALA